MERITTHTAQEQRGYRGYIAITRGRHTWTRLASEVRPLRWQARVDAERLKQAWQARTTTPPVEKGAV